MNEEAQWRTDAFFELYRRMRWGEVTGYVLLDCTRDAPDEFRYAPQARITLIPHAKYTGPPLALLRLTGADDPLLVASLDLARAGARTRRSGLICGWLYATCEVAQLASRLKTCLDVVVPSRRVGLDSAHELFRFFDPYVLLHLPSLLTPAQWKFLYGPLEGWAVLDWQANLAWLPPPGAEAGDTTRLLIKPDQWARIVRLGAVNHALASLARMGDPVETDTMTQADALVARFDHDYAGGRDQERTLFAVHGLRVHPAFDRHPWVAQAIAHAREQGHDLGEALNEFDDADWTRIGDELRRSATEHHRQGSLQ